MFCVYCYDEMKYYDRITLKYFFFLKIKWDKTLHTSAISVRNATGESPLSQLQHPHLIISDSKYNGRGKNGKV